MANWDESKHPRAEDGEFTSTGGGASVGRKTKSERSTDSFKRRMDEEGEVTELNELEAKYLKLAGGNPFDLSPEAEKALSDFTKKKADLQKRGIIAERIRGAKPGEGFKHKSTTDEMKRRTPVNMGDGRSSWTEEERKKFSDPTSHLKFVDLVKRKENAKMKKELGINADVCFGSAVALNWEAPADGSTTVKVQLSPFGEFTLHDGGKMNGAVQHCSKAAFEALVANWKAAGSPDVLVDVDHASARGGSTEAAAWCNSLEVDENGLQGVFNLTPKGLELVKNRSYRFVSPGWTLSPDGTPVSLCSVALTNRPNLPVKPVVNADFDESKHPRADDGKFTSGGGGSIRSKADAMRGSAEREVRATAQDGARLDLGTLNDELKASRYWVKKGSRAEDRAGGIARRKAAHRLAIMAGYKYNRSTGLYE